MTSNSIPTSDALRFALGALPQEDTSALDETVEEIDTRQLAETKEEIDAHRLAEVLASMSTPIAPPSSIKRSLLARIEQDRPILPLGDQVFVSLASQAEWMPTPVPGIRQRILYADPATDRLTVLLKLAPKTLFPDHPHPTVEECLLLSGDLTINGVTLYAGDYQRSSGGTHHAPQWSEEGCVALIITSLSAVPS